MKGFPDSHGPSGPLDRAEAIRQPWRSQWAAMRSRQPRRNCLAWFAAFAVLVCLLCLAWRAEPKKEEIQKMISDEEKEEFLEAMTHKILNRDAMDEILKAFRLFDDDETGKISFKNLKRVAKELGERMTDEELQEMIDEADRDGDGEVNEEEFLRIMKKTNLF